MRVPSFSRALLMGPRIARGPTQKMRNAVMRPSRLNDPPLPLPWNLATSFSSLDLKSIQFPIRAPMASDTMKSTG